MYHALATRLSCRNNARTMGVCRGVWQTWSGWTGGRAQLEGGGLLLWALEEGMGLAKARVVCPSLAKGGCASLTKNRPGCYHRPARGGRPGGVCARSGDALGCHKEVAQQGGVCLYRSAAEHKRGGFGLLWALVMEERGQEGGCCGSCPAGCWPREIGAAAWMRCQRGYTG